MPLRLTCLRLMSALLALGAASGCSVLGSDGPETDGGAAAGGGSPTGPAEVGYEEIDPSRARPPALGGGGDPGNETCDPGLRFDMAPNATHGRVSAAFVVAALQAGTWPNINRSLLRHDELLAYFARTDSSTPFARVRPSDEGEKLDVFVTVPPDGEPTHLILVVDTSTSMRNDLPLAGEIVSGFAAKMSEMEKGHLTIVEWGSEPRIFESDAGSTVPASAAAQLGVDFDVHAQALTKAQLGPGGSLGPAQVAVDAAIAAADSTPHIVVLTDGGVEADGDAFAAIESWATKRSAVISFIEIAGGSEDEDAKPQSFHREQLASMAAAGGGLTHFVTSETLPSLLNDFDGSFRIGRRSVLVRYEMPGITSLISSSDVEFAAGELGASLRPRWSAVGRPVFTTVGVTTCGPQQFEGKVTLDNDSTPVLVGDELDPRLGRLARIDQLYEILRQDCDGATPLIAAFGQTADGDLDLQALVDRAAELCPEP